MSTSQTTKELLINGYIRELEHKCNLFIPTNIKHVIESYGILILYFEKCNNERIKINEDDKTTYKQFKFGWSFTHTSFWIDISKKSIINLQINHIETANSIQMIIMFVNGVHII